MRRLLWSRIVSVATVTQPTYFGKSLMLAPLASRLHWHSVSCSTGRGHGAEVTTRKRPSSKLGTICGRLSVEWTIGTTESTSLLTINFEPLAFNVGAGTTLAACSTERR